ncbi:MAG: hypothetical protein Q8M39_04890 [Sulfuricurvum sp.]|nr:hypothetical protein [Sulfuricurvum sp.]
MILSKKWVHLSIIIPSIILLVSIFLLIWTDTYSVLHPENTSFTDEPNRNFIKVEYILAHPKKYNGFIFGSSRVSALLPSHVKGANFYNMTYSEGIPHEHLLNLRLFIKHGVKIKKLLLGLDDFSYQVSFAKHQQQWLTKAHPLATETSWFSFYKFYFFHLLTQQDKRQFIKKIVAHDNLIDWDIIGQEKFYQTFFYNGSNFCDDDPKYLKPTHYSGNTKLETLEDIKNIVTLCKQHHIELTVFINPIHHTTYQDTNKQLLEEFKSSLAKITHYYDFSGPNTTTQNNHNFIDTSHYTITVGDQILNRMNLYKNK